MLKTFHWFPMNYHVNTDMLVSHANLFGQFSSLIFPEASPLHPRSQPYRSPYCPTLQRQSAGVSSKWYLFLECLPSLLPVISHVSFKTDLGHHCSRKPHINTQSGRRSFFCLYFSPTSFYSQLYLITSCVSHLMLSILRGGNLKFHLHISNS